MTNTRLGLALLMTLLIGMPASVRATPVAVGIRVTTETAGPAGLVPAASAHVDVCKCSAPPSCFAACESYFASGRTDDYGNLTLYGSGIYFNPGLLVGIATIDGTTVRGVVLAPSNSMTLAIDPISEAAVELLAEHIYSGKQSVELQDLVRQANAHTEFAGVSLSEAIARARAAALDDPAVRAALPAWTPTRTPTLTPTPTQTPTRTLHPTGTPRACVGDCTNDGTVTIQELIVGVDLALDQLATKACDIGYPDGPPNVADLVDAVNNALYDCQPSTPLPDLVPVSVDTMPGPECIGNFTDLRSCFNVCVANVGDLAAAPFTIWMGAEGSSVNWSIGPLAAGDGECRRACGASSEGDVRVDADGDVREAREHNNALPYRFSTPTPPPRCPTPTPT